MCNLPCQLQHSICNSLTNIMEDATVPLMAKTNPSCYKEYHFIDGDYELFGTDLTPQEYGEMQMTALKYTQIYQCKNSVCYIINNINELTSALEHFSNKYIKLARTRAFYKTEIEETSHNAISEATAILKKLKAHFEDPNITDTWFHDFQIIIKNLERASLIIVTQLNYVDEVLEDDSSD